MAKTKGTPKPVFERIYGSLERMMNDPTTREHFLRQGADPILTTPAEMVAMIDADYARFGQAIKLAGLKVQ